MKRKEFLMSQSIGDIRTLNKDVHKLHKKCLKIWFNFSESEDRDIFEDMSELKRVVNILSRYESWVNPVKEDDNAELSESLILEVMYVTDYYLHKLNEKKTAHSRLRMEILGDGIGEGGSI